MYRTGGFRRGAYTTVLFSIHSLRLGGLLSILFFVAAGTASAQTATATFHSIGLEWTHSTGNPECTLEYRKLGTTTWLSGQSLWYDARDGEYRGSLVNLEPATTYEIRLTAGSQQQTITSTTWDEEFPIGIIVNVGTQTTTLVPTINGTASGYTLYTGGNINVNNNQDNCIEIPDGAHHIIIDNFILSGASGHGIEIRGDAHDIVIQNCDISNWGEGGFNNGTDGGIGTDDGPVERIIIQRNKIHDPRGGALSWRNGHPHGPLGIQMKDAAGNNVIRYNEIYASSTDHYFRDGMRGGTNFSWDGFPGANSDIYGNYVANVWDDAIEAEGGGQNVRIWGNLIEHAFVMFAIAPVSKGPLYIFRNVIGESRHYHDTENSDAWGRGPVFKAGSTEPPYISGRAYIYHNTALQPPPPPGKTDPLGCDAGLSKNGGDVYEHVTRNNMFELHDQWNTAFQDGTNSCTNDFEYDVYLGRIRNQCSGNAHQQNGQQASPIYLNQNFDDGEFELAPSSPGYSDAVYLPGFNSPGADVGAFEKGSEPMEFGVEAYQTGGGGGGGGSTLVTLFTEDFESVTIPGSVWSSGDFNNSTGLDYWGDQTSGSGARVHGGTKSAYCADIGGLSGQRYDHNMNAHLTKVNAINIAGLESVTLSFWLWYKTSNASDYVAVQYLRGSTWVELGRWSGSNSGSSQWAEQSVAIPSDAGSTLSFRWIFYSNGSRRSEGAYVDDVTVWGLEPAAARASGRGTETGALESDLNSLEGEVPGEFRLDQNYPNPFNPSTIIRFSLPEDAHAKLTVFDILGREVATLIDGFTPAGNYSVPFAAVGIANGVYFYALEAAGRRDTKRMLLLK